MNSNEAADQKLCVDCVFVAYAESVPVSLLIIGPPFGRVQSTLVVKRASQLLWMP